MARTKSSRHKMITWSNLPADILSAIFFRICLLDRLRCRAVCIWWAIIEKNNSPPPQLPWLMLSLSTNNRSHRFYSLSDKAIYWMNLPSYVTNAVCCGCFDDWLVFSSEKYGNFSLNPFSKQRFTLPDSRTLPFPSLEPQCLNPFFIHKVILSSDPNKPNRPFLAALFCSGFLALSKVGSNSWFPGLDFFRFEDILFSEGKLYTISVIEELFVFNLIEDKKGNPFITSVTNHVIEERTDLAEDAILFENGEKYRYLVETCSTCKLFMILLIWEGDFAYSVTRIFKAYELDRTSKPFKWVKKNSLDGHTIFLSRSCSKALLASQYEGLQEDLIYFSDDIRDMKLVNRPGYPSGDTGVFNMRDGSINRFIENRGNSSLCPPTWFFVSNRWYMPG